MANLVINKVHFKIINSVIPIWISTKDFFGAKKKQSSIFEGIIEAGTIQQNKFLYYSLAAVQNITEYSINLATKKYFIKPYISAKFRNYFEQKGLMTIDDFVNGIQVWTAKGVKQKFREYEKINLRQLSISNLSKLELLVSFDGISYTTLQTVSKINITGNYSKYIENGTITRVKADQPVNVDAAYPILSYSLKKELGFQFENSIKKIPISNIIKR